MSESAFSIGTVVRFHEIVSAHDAVHAQQVLLSTLTEQGFTAAPELFTAEGWQVRHAVLGDDKASNVAGFALEIFPLLSLVGMRRPIARCAAPVAARTEDGGSRLVTTTVWGRRGEAGTVGYAARRVARAVERASEHLGGTLRSSMGSPDPTAPVDGRQFQQLTHWRSRRGH